jgi:hypothetical protein
LRREARNAITAPISSGSPARPRSLGSWKSSAMMRFRSSRLFGSMPRCFAMPCSQVFTPPDRNVPGETVFTRMFSLASVLARFLLTLVSADFAAV